MISDDVDWGYTCYPKILKRAGLSIDDLEAYEVSEAFASVPRHGKKNCGLIQRDLTYLVVRSQ